MQNLVSKTFIPKESFSFTPILFSEACQKFKVSQKDRRKEREELHYETHEKTEENLINNKKTYRQTKFYRNKTSLKFVSGTAKRLVRKQGL